MKQTSTRYPLAARVVKTFLGWCLATVLLLGTCGAAAWAQGPTTFGWQREYYGVPAGVRNPTYKSLDYAGIVRISRTRYAVAGLSFAGNVSNIPFVQFVNARGDSLTARHYPLNIYSPQGYNQIDEIGARTDYCFTTLSHVRDSLGRYGSELMIGDSLGRLRVRRYFNLNYRSVPYNQHLFMLPDNGCLVIQHEVLSNLHLSPRIYRFDADGNQVWARPYPTQDHEIAAIVPRLDGSYALIGTKLRPLGPNGPYPFDVWVGGLTAWGDTLPARRYTRLRGNDDPAGGVSAALLPDGGLVLVGITHPLVPPPFSGNHRNDGYLLRLSPTGQVLAQQTVTSPVTARSTPNCELHAVQVLADGRIMTIGPYLRNLTSRTDGFDAAVLTFDATTLAPLGQQFYAGAPYGVLGTNPLRVLYEAGGTVTVQGTRNRPQPAPSLNLDQGIGLLRLTGPPLYQLPYCQTPPAATFTATLGAASDTLRVRDASTPGPQYGQVVLWHWQWGDGSSSDGPTPGPHRYAPVPAAGTPVTLTITNNLGCTSTLVRYPWGRPSATQAAQALAAALEVYPNPATGTAQVRLAGLAPQSPVPAALLDALGRAVWQGALPVQAGALAHALDLSGLAAGVYTLRLLPREGPLTRRLVVR